MLYTEIKTALLDYFTLSREGIIPAGCYVTGEIINHFGKDVSIQVKLDDLLQ